MNNIVSFILGAIVGAAVALLYAPQSGEELRANLREEAQVERQRLQAQYEKSMQDLQEAINRVQVDLQSLLQQVEEQEEETAETA
jgi:gas vesicle protein